DGVAGNINPKQGTYFRGLGFRNLMDRGIFPPAVQLSPRRIAWRDDDIEYYKGTRPPAGDPPPQLWPVRERQRRPVDPARRPGRPPGTRITVDENGRRRVIRPDEHPSNLKDLA